MYFISSLINENNVSVEIWFLQLLRNIKLSTDLWLIAVSCIKYRSRTYKFLSVSCLSPVAFMGFIISTQLSCIVPVLLLRFSTQEQRKRLLPSCRKASVINNANFLQYKSSEGYALLLKSQWKAQCPLQHTALDRQAYKHGRQLTVAQDVCKLIAMIYLTPVRGSGKFWVRGLDQ
jgi:hypothetical protein